MNKKYLYSFVILIILGALAFFVGDGEYLSNYLVNARGLCSSGGNKFVQTFGIYNCYVELNKYLIWTGYLFLAIAVISLFFGIRKNNKENITI